jgi:hypothetical protein
MIDGATTIGGSAMFADVLNAPIAELSVGDNIDAGQHLVDTWALLPVRRVKAVIRDG